MHVIGWQPAALEFGGVANVSCLVGRELFSPGDSTQSVRSSCVDCASKGVARTMCCGSSRAAMHAVQQASVVGMLRCVAELSGTFTMVKARVGIGGGAS